MFKDVPITLVEAQGIERVEALAKQWFAMYVPDAKLDYGEIIDCVCLDFGQKPGPAADQVRDAIGGLWLRPRILSVKLLLIFNAQMMNQQVANALLKTL